MKDYYMMLDVSLDADNDAITKAYKKKALELHPDKNQDDPYYTAKFQEIQEAYSVLSDSTLRHDYDEQYRSRIDFTINRVENLSSLPDENLPDYIHGVYEMEIREYHKDLARLYAEGEVIDEYVYKSYALGLFHMITDRAPSFDNYLDEIKHFRDPNTLKDAFFKPLSFIHPSAEREAFYQKYVEYLIANYHGELSENQLTIRCIFTRGEISSKEKRIITFEYIVMVLHYSSFLHESNKPSEVMNNSPLAQVLREISPLIHSRGIEYMKEGGVWKPIVGALALGNDDAHKELMQKLKEDKIEDKIDNIQTITKLAELACQSEDYSQDNMFGFAYTIRQLNTYTSNDPEAIQSLQRLKELFLGFAKKLYYSFDANGKEVEASALINHLGEKILIDDDGLRSKLKVLWTGETAPSYTKSKGGCFIATACYGDYNAPEVMILREYRNEILIRSVLGRIFIQLYYKVSPPLARFIVNKPQIKKFLKNRIFPFFLNRL